MVPHDGGQGDLQLIQGEGRTQTAAGATPEGQILEGREAALQESLRLESLWVRVQVRPAMDQQSGDAHRGPRLQLVALQRQRAGQQPPEQRGYRMEAQGLGA